MKKINGVLILSPFFSPNIGGVESHLDDLVSELNAHQIRSYVLTYSPLTTKSPYLSRETIGHCQIIRYKWFGYQVFPKLEKYPIFDFLYITPYLLIRTFWWLLKNHKKVNLIHSQGFNAAFMGNILAKIFQLKHLCSTHAVYENIGGISKQITVRVLSKCDQILCLSKASIDQLENWGVNPNKLSLYRYWIDLKNFSPVIPPPKLTFLFVGRLIAKKGIWVILNTAAQLTSNKFIIVGNGPLESEVEEFSSKYKNIQYLGAVQNKNLPQIYHQANVFCIASQYPEGYGRVIMEAVASGLPVIGSNMGAIPEALDETVSLLFSPTLANFIKNINYLVKNPAKYSALQKKCRSYAQNKFSHKNFEIILKAYQKLLDTTQSPDAAQYPKHPN
ncbi:MAG: glycosyltransferase family 4 protein [Candidatus Shapirobacteria bacterium]